MKTKKFYTIKTEDEVLLVKEKEVNNDITRIELVDRYAPFVDVALDLGMNVEPFPYEVSKDDLNILRAIGKVSFINRLLRPRKEKN